MSSFYPADSDLEQVLEFQEELSVGQFPFLDVIAVAIERHVIVTMRRTKIEYREGVQPVNEQRVEIPAVTP